MNQARQFAIATGHAGPAPWPQRAPVRAARRGVSSPECWLVLLIGLTLSGVVSTIVQATPSIVHPQHKAEVPTGTVMPLVAENAATSPAAAPFEPEPSDRAADRTASARDVTAPGTLAAALGSTNLGVSPLYGQAAVRYGQDRRVLRALHAVESTTASSGCLANRQGSGAMGPFQFKPATFRQYGVDADGDGRPNICGFADSLFSAARYLQALGADARAESAQTYRALVRYGTHAGRVVALATRLAG